MSEQPRLAVPGLHYNVYSMIRTQITLDAELHRRALKRAAQLGMSLSAYIRRALQRDLGERRAGVSATAVFDLGDSGGSDIAQEKDALIASALSAVSRRKGRGKR